MIAGAARSAALLLLTGIVWAATSSAIWIDVPFVHQSKEGCGAASIAMVMMYWAQQRGVEAGPESDATLILRQLYSRKEQGITVSSMQEYLREHGYLTFALDGSWDDLKEQLSKGRPLIAALRPEGQSELHYVVIDGIDPVHELVTMNDPAERKLLTRERAGFEKEWRATHNWMLLALPAPASPK